jgi:phosphatidylglycerophosphatase C
VAQVSTVDDILALAERQTPKDVARAAVLDADGTIWRGDIGDEAFLHAMDEGLVNEESWQRVREFADEHGVTTNDYARFARMIVSGELLKHAKSRGVDDDVFRKALYEMQACVYAGQPRTAILEYGKRLFARGFATGIFADMRRLIDHLVKQQMTIVIVSASHGALVESARDVLGVSLTRGMEPVLDDKAITQPTIAFSTYGIGKVHAVNDVLGGRRPLMSFGDSVLFTDRELLAHAEIPVAVNTRGAHRDAAIEKRMLLLDPT